MTLKFECNYCPAVIPHFKALVEHYRKVHEGKLKRYEIRNHKVKQVALMYASKPEELLECLGWDSKDCKVKEVK